MSDNVILALPYLFDKVVEQFEADSVAIPNCFGRKESARGSQMNPGIRIVWIPGNLNGDLGAILPAKNPGGNPRSLATLEELFTVEIVVTDSFDPENDRAQYQAVREVFDQWYRAVYLAVRGTFRVVSGGWVTSKLERASGAAVRIVCAIQAQIPDRANKAVSVTTKINADVELLDVTEEVTTVDS